MKRFAIIGVAGYIAPRHLQAIRDTEMWSLLRATSTTWCEFSTATFTAYATSRSSIDSIAMQRSCDDAAKESITLAFVRPTIFTMRTFVLPSESEHTRSARSH